jgi:hypothetical protein
MSHTINFKQNSKTATFELFLESTHSCQFSWATYYLCKMPSAERRTARTNRLLRVYKSARKAFEKRLRHRKAHLRRSFQLAKAQGLYRSKAFLESLSDISPHPGLSHLCDKATGIFNDPIQIQVHNHYDKFPSLYQNYPYLCSRFLIFRPQAFLSDDDVARTKTGPYFSSSSKIC